MAAAVAGAGGYCHMVYHAPPEMSTVARVFEVSKKEGVPVWKGRLVEKEGVEGVEGDPAENVFLTHRIGTGTECAHVLATIGCPESVIVVEAIKELEMAFNGYYNSMRKLYWGHVMPILACIGTLVDQEDKQKTGCFSRFAYALHQGSKLGKKGPVADAIRDGGAQLFWMVTDAVIEDNPDNSGLQRMVSTPNDRMATILAWSLFHTMRTVKDVTCHPFAVLDGDAQSAMVSLSVLRFLGDKYETSSLKRNRDLSCLIHASVPFLLSSIEKEAEAAKEVERQEAPDVEARKRLLLPPDDQDDSFDY